MKTIRGFTLLELMIALAIFGILLGWAVPAFKQMMASNRLTTNANNLVYAFQVARNEAVTRGRSIDVVASGGGWSAGWSVKDGANTIMKWDVLAGNVNIAEISGINDFQFNAQGRLAASGRLKLIDPSCPTGSSTIGRQVDVILAGRASATNITLTCP